MESDCPCCEDKMKEIQMMKTLKRHSDEIAELQVRLAMLESLNEKE